MSVVRIIGLAALLTLAALPGSASAMFTQQERVSRITAETSENKQITVSCPSGKRVLGAGFDVTPGNGHVLVDAIRPNAALTRVTARAHEDETGTSANWYVGAFAVCAAPPAGMVRVVATSSSSSAAAKSAVAACPAGKRLLGVGGEITGGDGQVLLDGLLPSAALTQATVNALEDETGHSGAWSVSAYAICSNPVAGLERTSVTGSLNSTANRVTTAPCPEGKGLVSASGTINSPNGQIVLDAMFPDEPVTVAGFAAFEDDTGNTADWSLTTYAICAARARRVTVTSARDRMGGGNLGSTCAPSGEDITGFGGEITGGLGEVWLNGLYDGEVGGPPGRGFFADATPDVTGVSSPYALTAHGICATAVPGHQIVTARSVSDAADSKSAIVACPEGLNVLGAGAQTDHKSQLSIDALRPDPSLTFVTASGHEDAAGRTHPWAVIAYAICAPPPPGLQLVQRSSPTASEEFATATAACPAGKHLIGTGAEIDGGNASVGFDDVRPDAALTRTSVVATEDELGTDANWNTTAYSICIDR